MPQRTKPQICTQIAFYLVINGSQWRWIKEPQVTGVFAVFWENGKMEANCCADVPPRAWVLLPPLWATRRSRPPCDQPVIAPDKSREDSWGGRASASTFPNTHIHPYWPTKNSTAEGHIPHLPQRERRSHLPAGSYDPRLL